MPWKSTDELFGDLLELEQWSADNMRFVMLFLDGAFFDPGRRRSKGASLPHVATIDLFLKRSGEAGATVILEHLRWWEHGMDCPHCSGGDLVRLKTGDNDQLGLWYCRSCDSKFSVTVKSPIHRTRIPHSTWCRCLCLLTHISNARLTTLDLQRQLGVSWVTACKMRKKGEVLIENWKIRRVDVTKLPKEHPHHTWFMSSPKSSR